MTYSTADFAHSRARRQMSKCNRFALTTFSSTQNDHINTFIRQQGRKTDSDRLYTVE